jgi:DNA-binding transcriptional MerR regulator
MNDGLLRIGELASSLGISTRTLRYYEEVGLLTPGGRTSGGSRRYTELDRARVAHIRTLQEVMGFDLDRIRRLLAAEDGLARLRAEYHAGAAAERKREIVAEAVVFYDQMLAEIDAKRRALAEFRADISARMARAKGLAQTAP